MRRLGSSLAVALVLLASALPAAAVPSYIPTDDTITVDRTMLVWLETSPWDAAGGETPDALDGAWSGPYTASLVWGMETVTLSAMAIDADFDCWQTGAMGGVCTIVGDITGTIDRTFTAGMGPMTVTVFSPLGSLVAGEVREPSTALLLGLGLVGLSVAGRDRY